MIAGSGAPAQTDGLLGMEITRVTVRRKFRPIHIASPAAGRRRQGAALEVTADHMAPPRFSAEPQTLDVATVYRRVSELPDER